MAAPRSTSTTRVIFRLMRNDWRAFVLAWSPYIVFFLSPLAVGAVLKLVLDHFTDGTAGVPLALLAVLIGLEVGRWSILVVGAVLWHGAWVGWLTVPRVNALSSLATGSGPAASRLPGSPGEAVSRFRDDAHDLGMVLDAWIDVGSAVIAAAIGLTVLAAIDPVAAMSVALPVGAALLASVWLGPRLRAWRRASREATGSVTSFLGDTFGSVLAVKVGGGEAAVDRRFAQLNAERAVVSRRDQLGREVIRSLGYGTGEVTIGIVLLIVAGSFRRGELTVGDIGLFATYISVVAQLPKWIGRLGAYHQQADVSVDRLAELMADGHRRSAVQPVQTYLRHGPPPLDPLPSDAGSFHVLTVEGLTVRHPRSGRGVFGVDLEVRAGELVVVTGRVGSGKSTLLRGLLGLVSTDAGWVRWNGEVVADPSTFLVPPRVAYLPQVPRLFSEPLADTVLLGLPDEGLGDALWLACLDEDVEQMTDGVRTLIGPRGLRLSGGQVQRAGAARALVRRPHLLLVDDLSSALDVDTEIRLWERFTADSGRTALLVSHRPHVLELADRVVVLEEGRVVSRRIGGTGAPRR